MRRFVRRRHLTKEIDVTFKTLSTSAIALLLLTAAPAHAQDHSTLSLPSSVPSGIFAGGRSADVLIAQVLLDRLHHSPGVIDGMMGGNTKRAVRAFQRVRGLPVTGEITPDLLRKLLERESGDIVQSYTIKEADVEGPFRTVPQSMAAMADGHVGYESPAEALAEKFHMARSFLEALNPGADFGRAGETIVVVKAGDDRLGKQVDRVEIDKSRSALRAYGSDGSLLATYPATIGSNEFPSPSGTMEVRAIAAAPTYHFDPTGRSWGPDEALTIPAGPNNPVGGTWIDLTKEGYGIHGTPEPRLIGKTASHGCVRLTNWDAEELAHAVHKDTEVVFL